MSDVDQAAFRRAAGQFPGGIVVVTTSAGHAMTVSAFASVSLEPPLVLFCAEKIARFHDAVLAAGAWAVSILAEDGEKTARWLATRGRPLEGQLDELPHHPGPVTGAPLLDGALATHGMPDLRRLRRRRPQHHRRPGRRRGQPGLAPRGAAPGPPAGGRSSTTPAATAASAPPKTDPG